MANPPPVPVCHKIITPAIMTSLGIRLTKAGRARHEESVKKGRQRASVESKGEARVNDHRSGVQGTWAEQSKDNVAGMTI